MRNLLALLSLATLVFILACSQPQAASNVADSASAPAPSAQEEAPRISLENAKNAFDANTAIFIDARSEDNYRDEHIKGAINVTFDTLDKKIKTLPKDKTIVVYCS
jgi:3-mercaptopyruvate sulfurtransferase SseA